jgi:indole-3-glycerol phosphate synthase|tara:strand:- start:174 stop:563 length:390 start_codon:yes stop_codon:yes gene_type:complete
MLITTIPQYVQGLKNVKLVAITDATADGAILYTAPSAADFNASVITSILVSEYSGNADTITVTVTDSTATFSLFKVKAVAANTTIELLTKDLILQSGDVIRASAATASRLHVVASIQELALHRTPQSAL